MKKAFYIFLVLILLMGCNATVKTTDNDVSEPNDSSNNRKKSVVSEKDDGFNVADTFELYKITDFVPAIEYILNDVIKDLKEHGDKPGNTRITIRFLSGVNGNNEVCIQGLPYGAAFDKGTDNKKGYLCGYLFHDDFLVTFVNPVPYSSVDDEPYVETDSTSTKKAFVAFKPKYTVGGVYEWRYEIKENIQEGSYKINRLFRVLDW